MKRGFTLIELLVVIAIIGLLASIVLVSLNSARARGRDAKRIAEMHSIQTALELYATSNGGHYPVGGWNSQCVAWGGFPANSVIPGLVPNNISVMPADPGMVASANTDCYLYLSLDGNDYKILDYNLTSEVNVPSAPTFIDPARNYGQSYGRPAGCSNTESTRAWAIWSSANSMCW